APTRFHPVGFQVDGVGRLVDGVDLDLPFVVDRDRPQLDLDLSLIGAVVDDRRQLRAGHTGGDCGDVQKVSPDNVERRVHLEVGGDDHASSVSNAPYGGKRKAMSFETSPPWPRLLTSPAG